MIFMSEGARRSEKCNIYKLSSFFPLLKLYSHIENECRERPAGEIGRQVCECCELALQNVDEPAGTGGECCGA